MVIAKYNNQVQSISKYNIIQFFFTNITKFRSVIEYIIEKSLSVIDLIINKSLSIIEFITDRFCSLKILLYT